MFCSSVWRDRFMVKSLAQPGQMVTFIHLGLIAGIHVRIFRFTSKCEVFSQQEFIHLLKWRTSPRTHRVFCLTLSMVIQQPLQSLQLLLAKSHDLAGLVALALGLFAMAAPKQGIGHRRSGRIAMIAMVILIALALVLLLTYLLPNNPSRGQGPQLLFYLLVVAWMASYSLLAGYRWASTRRSYPIPAWDIPLTILASSGALLSLGGLIWDISTPPSYNNGLMAGAFGSELTFVLNGGAFLWFAAEDLRVLQQGPIGYQERTTKHVVRLTMLMYSLTVAVILVNVAPRLFAGMHHPAAYLFSLGVPAIFFVPVNALLLRQSTRSRLTDS